MEWINPTWDRDCLGTVVSTETSVSSGTDWLLDLQEDIYNRS